MERSQSNKRKDFSENTKHLLNSGISECLFPLTVILWLGSIGIHFLWNDPIPRWTTISDAQLQAHKSHISKNISAKLLSERKLCKKHIIIKIRHNLYFVRFQS